MGHSFYATYFVVEIESKQVLPVSSSNNDFEMLNFHLMVSL